MKPGVPWSNPGGHLQESAFQGLEIIPALLEARAGLAMDDPVGLVILRAESWLWCPIPVCVPC